MDRAFRARTRPVFNHFLDNPMSDTTLFIIISSEELTANGQLPGDLRGLRGLVGSDGRLVHCEVLADAPLPEKTQNALHMAGALLTVLPSSADTSAALVGGLMGRLHEFIHAYPQVSRFILAGADPDRLAPAAAFLRRAGFNVTLAGSDKSRLDAVAGSCDDTTVWSGGRGSGGRDSKSRDRDGRGRDRDGKSTPKDSAKDAPRESAGSKLDPYEVLVEEITKARQKGNRVLLTSLKQRLRKRIRRFDETRLKDKDGKPMKQFKDFIVDAVNRGLVQLVEKGNASQVLLPGEDIPEDDPDSPDEETTDSDTSGDSGDPLLDNVEMPPEQDGAEEDIPELQEKDFKVDQVNEDAPAPSENFLRFMDNYIAKEGLALGELLLKLGEEREAGNLDLDNRQIKTELQNAFYNELLETVNDDDPARYVVVDDWRDIIDFL